MDFQENFDWDSPNGGSPVDHCNAKLDTATPASCPDSLLHHGLDYPSSIASQAQLQADTYYSSSFWQTTAAQSQHSQVVGHPSVGQGAEESEMAFCDAFAMNFHVSTEVGHSCNDWDDIEMAEGRDQQAEHQSGSVSPAAKLSTASQQRKILSPLRGDYQDCIDESKIRMVRECGTPNKKKISKLHIVDHGATAQQMETEYSVAGDSLALAEPVFDITPTPTHSPVMPATELSHSNLMDVFMLGNGSSPSDDMAANSTPSDDMADNSEQILNVPSPSKRSHEQVETEEEDESAITPSGKRQKGHN